MRTVSLPECIGTTQIQKLARDHGCEVVVTRDNQFRIYDPREQTNVVEMAEVKKPARRKRLLPWQFADHEKGVS